VGAATALLLGAALVLAGCGRQHSTSAGPTGLGATKRVWSAHHGSDYSSILTDSAGRVTGYILTWPKPRSLAQALAQVRSDLPADATASRPQLTVGIEMTECDVVVLRSATLRTALDGAAGSEVVAAFQAKSANVMNTGRIVRAVVLVAAGDRPLQC
jgi:hypothetical protein